MNASAHTTQQINKQCFAYFQVEVDDVVFVDVVHCLANLPHEYRAGLFGEEEFVVEHSVEQFTAVDPVKGDLFTDFTRRRESKLSVNGLDFRRL